jgi:hypothetical protein
VHTRHAYRVPALTAMLAAIVMALAPVAQATKLRPQNLTQLIAESDSIIAGVVRSVTDGIDEKGVPYTEVTILVSDAAKGSMQKDAEYTFRQFGLLKPRTMPNGHQYIAISPAGFPRWQRGESVVAFLYKPAAHTGLQTTAGMTQGKLTLINGQLANEFGNAGLFDGVEIDPRRLTAADQEMLNSSGAVDAATFMSLVGRAVDGRWVETGEMR